MDLTLVLELVTIALAILSVVGGLTYRKAKTKVKQLSELLSEIVKAWEDDQVTNAEFAAIVEKARRLIS